MQSLFFNLIGAGRLGKNLALSLVSSGQISLRAILNKKFSSAEQTQSLVNQGKPLISIMDLPSADITFITTPDDDIALIALELAQKKIVRPGSTVVHCSGVLSSEVLKPLQEQGCYIASFHPLKAFRADVVDQNCFKNCDCAIEGDEQAIVILSTLFKPLGANLVTVDASKKILYHAAAVLAANHLVTLAAQAIELFVAAGIAEQEAKPIITRLMQTSLTNIQCAPSLTAALTGPLVRGDINTIAKHINAQKNLPTLSLYKLLSLKTLPLTNLSLTQKNLLINMLTE
ncbi:Uncharacterized conserved protein [Legionella busanensis]|uniref:Uncharacterized conserved protein n=1 Tax=Legionella busanensis TaxID=190655 RepID=A0A378JFH7_9GAMM|nr:DUF2520 domain-containing protein [Legionella busanensis]STX49945.1 Uncharacterized conserved protein [Legionella busanensis]